MATNMEASMFIMFIMFNMHVCVWVCVYVCMHIHVHVCMGHKSTPQYPPYPIYQPTTPRGDPKISINSITLELIEIFQFCLKIWNLWRLSSPMIGCMAWWVGGWVGWWVGSCQIIKNFKKCWPNQDNSILFEDLWFVETPTPMGGCVGGWVDGWVNGWGQVKSLTIG